MGHIGHEPPTSQSSISTPTESTPTIPETQSKPSGPANNAHDNMETKPRFDGIRFDSQIFDLYIGTEKRHFAIHRAVLNQSPLFRSLCNTQALSKSGGVKIKTTLALELDSPQGMGHLLEYLYTNKFAVRGADPLDEAKQLADLYLLAGHYMLPGLQEAVISQLELSHTSSKVTAMQFFNMAEDLYSEEPHVVMREYFARVAPGLLRTVAEQELEELLRMISEGGDFATDLFTAHHQAFGPGHLPISHPESESQDGPLPKRLQTEGPPAGPISIRTAWDDANEIPSFWHEMSEADKLLVTMREEGKSWNEIDVALKEKHGKTGSITEWLNRYGRISINMAHMRLKKGDVDRLFTAKEQVETNFLTEKWSLIAYSMEKNGAERYRSDFLQKKFTDLEIALRARGQANAISVGSTTVSCNENCSTNAALYAASNGSGNGVANGINSGAAHGSGNKTTQQALGDNNAGATPKTLHVTQNAAANRPAEGWSAGKIPTGRNPVVNRIVIGGSNGIAKGVPNARASARTSGGPPNKPSDTSITGITSNPAPVQSKKRPNSAMNDVPNAGSPKRGSRAPVSNSTPVKAENARKPLTGESKAEASQEASGSKGGPNSRLVDADYVALDDDDDDDDDDMSED